MEQWQQSVIMDNISSLQERTTANTMLLAILQANNVLSQADVNIINSLCSLLEKTKKLYEIILSRRNGYNVLLEALEQTKQSSAAFILLNAKRKVLGDDTSSTEKISIGESESNMECDRDDGKGPRFVECVNGLQTIISSPEHQFTVISTINSKLTLSKIKDTLGHPNIWIRHIDILGPVMLDKNDAEEIICRGDGNKRFPIWVLYEKPGSPHSNKLADMSMFKYLKAVIENSGQSWFSKKIVIVLQCDKQTVETSLSKHNISNVCVISDKFSWEQLSISTQMKLLKQPQSVKDRGVLKSLSHLFRLYAYEKDSHLELFTEFLQGQLLVDILNDKEPEIFRKTIPRVKTNYYIPRTLRKRSCISKSIFKSDSPHDIIVVTDIITDLDQSDIVNDFDKRFGPCNGNVDLSISQRKKKKLTAKCILLSNPNDFDQICKTATANNTMTTVHLLAYNNKRFFWKETRGACNMQIIHANICTECQNELSEEEVLISRANQELDGEQGKADDEAMAERINETNASEPIIICGAPGTGKSIVLASLANTTERMTDRKNSLVLFFLMADFISSVRRHLNENETEISLEALKKVLYDGVSGYGLNHWLLYEPSKAAPTSLHLFFDGLDEVPVDSLELAYSCLQKIRDGLKPVRLYVTTRRNLLEQVESKLKTLAYNIQPFSQNDQLEFLTRFWSSLRQAKGEEIRKDLLLAYTKTCLEILEKNTGEKNIAGVPLQCLIIGEVFHDDAQEYSDSNLQLTMQSVRSTITINSLNELYERILQTKYETFRKRYLQEKKLQLDTQALERVHIFVGIKSVFNDKNYHKQLGRFLLDEAGFAALRHMFGNWNGNVDEFHAGALPRQDLLNVGIVEARDNEDLCFTDRTFAEYLIAKFSASHLIKNDSNKEMIEFVNEAVLNTDKETVTISEHYKLVRGFNRFKFPVICQFLNSFFQHASWHVPNKCRTERSSNEEDRIVHACIHGNLKNLLQLYLENCNYKRDENVHRTLLLLAARFSSSKAIDLLDCRVDLFVNYPPSPLHIAIEQGQKSLVIHLLTKHGFRKVIRKWKRDLVYLCVAKTKNQNENSINDRVGILNVLEKVDRGIISEACNEIGILPIFHLSIHIKILTSLFIHLKSEILLNEQNRRILQLASEFLTDHENLEFLSVMESYHKAVLNELRAFKNLDKLKATTENMKLHEMITSGKEDLAGSCEQNRSESRLVYEETPAEKNTRFLECVDGLQSIISSPKLPITLISTRSSKLTVSKIKDTLKHPKIWIKPIGDEGHVTLDQASVKESACLEGSEDAEPLWVLYENTTGGPVADFDRFYRKLFQYLKLQTHGKMVVVLQCEKQTIESYVTMISLNNVHVLSDHFCWEQLNPFTQVKLLKQPQTVLNQGIMVSLSELIGVYSNEKESHIQSQLFQGQLLIDILNGKKPEIFRKTIPEFKNNCYIPRRLRERSCVSQSIFKSTFQDQVIVVSDIIPFLDQTDIINDFILSFGPCNGIVDLSLNQICDNNLTADFILLTHHNHFTQIFDNLVNDCKKSLHLLVYKEGKFLWKETRGACNMTSIHDNLCPDSQQEEFHENEIYKEGSTRSVNNPFIICDSPGMGKSTLLANLATKIGIRESSLVLFFVMADFIALARSFMKKNADSKISQEALLDTINKSASDYQLPKTFLMRPSTANLLHIFFDGLDEVHPDDNELAYDCLQKISKEFKFTRLYITTRMNLMKQVECRMKSLAYDIQPFGANDQVNFLSGYWSDMRLENGEKINENILLVYIITLLKTLKSALSKRDAGIAGVPLQCLLIAEAFQNEAQRYADVTSKLTEKHVTPTINISSITELYERVLQKKYEAFRGRHLHSKRKKLSFEPLDNVHAYVAIKAVFTEYKWHKNLRCFLLNKNGFDVLKQTFVDWNGNFSEYQAGCLPIRQLINVGIIKVGAKEELQFIHRTFAEYFIAKFAASHLISTGAPKEIKDFIEQAVLRTDQTNLTISQHYKLSLTSYQFRFPVICHFLNSIVAPSSEPTNKIVRDMTKDSIRDYRIVHACIKANYNNILQHYLVGNTQRGMVEDEQTNFLLLAACVGSPETFSLFDYGDHRDFFLNDDPNPLHIAIENGNKVMVAHLLSMPVWREIMEFWMEFKLTEIQQLINLCIKNTKNMSDNLINDRIEILNALEKAIPGIISKAYLNQTRISPIFQLSVHINIINALIKNVKPDILLKKEGDDKRTILEIAEENLNTQENQAFLSVMAVHHQRVINELGMYIKSARQADLQSLVIGNDNDCPLNRVVSAMSRSPSSSSLDANWYLLAMGFGTSTLLKDNLILEKTLGMATTEDILWKLLHEWRSHRKEKATLLELIRILSRNNMMAIAESLIMEFSHSVLSKFDDSKKDAEDKTNKVSIQIGGPDCPFNKLVHAIQRSRSYALLIDSWTRLARALGIHEATISTLRTSLLFNKTLTDVLTHIIMEWVNRRDSSEATLENLIAAFNAVALYDIGATLQEEFVKEAVSSPANEQYAFVSSIVPPIKIPTVPLFNISDKSNDVDNETFHLFKLSLDQLTYIPYKFSSPQEAEDVNKLPKSSKEGTNTTDLLTASSFTLTDLLIAQPPDVDQFDIGQNTLQDVKCQMSLEQLVLSPIYYSSYISCAFGGCPPKSCEESSDTIFNFTTASIFSTEDLQIVRPTHAMFFPNDHYNLREDEKGFALILNIVNYEQEMYVRRGAKHDSFYMKQVWEQLGYKVTVEDEGTFTKTRVKKIVHEFQGKCNKKKPRSAVVFIGGHGELGQLVLSNLKERLQIYRDIINKFTTEKCPGLDGKPKIFIISACQEWGNIDELPIPVESPSATESVDGPTSSKRLRQTPPLDDTIVCYSTVPGFYSYQGRCLGTAYIYCLTKILIEQAHKMHFKEIQELVEKTMATIEKTRKPFNQRPNYHLHGFKELYFYVLPNE